MANDRSFHHKAPSQKPVDFFECKQQGGTHGKPTSVGEKQASGKMREQIYGRKSLAHK